MILRSRKIPAHAAPLNLQPFHVYGLELWRRASMGVSQGGVPECRKRVRFRDVRPSHLDRL